MNYATRKYPQFAVCGLNCGLCPRHYTVGNSRCPGCAGEGFLDVHPTCGILSCCQRKGLEYCFQCDEFPCKKYDKLDKSDSFITYKNRFHDMEKAKLDIETYKAELNEKIEILQELLENYDDGRRKSFFCTAVNLLELEDVKSVMERVSDTKSAVAAFNEMVELRGISLKLRK
ncbi:MAG: DUF3795 domain-containing protein [Oscillospiraceae bacterium]|nr:DUF3795 domain-containing protein [Oscillospiraceae bacterium]